MNYKFPEIRIIDDVLPHIKDREEFIVAERDFGTVINYAVAKPDSFDMASPDDLGGAVRRECRGIMFDREGNIMSRPFHKFFNINERKETQSNVADMTQPHVIMEKMDGSMIRPILVDGYLRLATKMGVTTVAMQAEEWLVTQNPALKDWLRQCVEDSVTPLFEWVSPFNQIVLAYEEANLVYLGTRDNVTGAYVMDTSCPFTVVPQYGSVEGNISDYVARQRQAEGREGDIIRWTDGHMVKCKNDWYVEIHKVLERIVFDRNIVKLIINEKIDDTIGKLPEVRAAYVREFETVFWEAFGNKERYLHGRVDEARMHYGTDRKAIATQYVPFLEDKQVASLLFRVLDGHKVRDVLMQHIEKHISSNTKWDACAKWMEMT